MMPRAAHQVLMRSSMTTSTPAATACVSSCPKSYYTHAKDKRTAMRALLDLKDPKQILAHSGWRAGVIHQ
jgi:heterodisulfide reductase subunit C